MQTTDYQKQAQEFLTKHGITFRATLSNSKPAHWQPSGHHYRVTLSKKEVKEVWPHHPKRFVFDFWSSKSDMDKGIKTLSPYDALACISGDVNCPETLTEFCSEYGYEEDSIKALQTFNRCLRFSKRLQEFFTDSEIADLQEIQ